MGCGLLRSELERIVSEVWAVVPGFPIKGAEDSVFAEEPLRAAIAVTGDWRGEIILEIDRSLAERASRTMFDTPDDEDLSEEKLWDALKEMVNMFGGSLKSALPASCKLGLPRANVERAMTNDEGEEVIELSFISKGLPLRLRCAHDSSGLVDQAGALLDGLV